MRTLLACLLIALPAAGLAGVSAAQDRYGPPAAAGETASADTSSGGSSASAGYQGPYLSWASKTPAPDAPPAPPPPEAPVVQPAAVPAPPPAPERRHRVVAILTAPARPTPPAAEAEPLPPPAPPPAAYVPPPAPEPAPLAAAAPPPEPAPPPPVAVVAPPPAPAAPPAQAMAQNTPPPAAPATPAAPPVSARYYSLHRDYGDTPDPITVPTDRPMVLVGPSADAPPAKSGDDFDKSPADGDSPDAQSGPVF